MNRLVMRYTNILIASYILLVLIQSNFLTPLVNFNFADLVKFPLPPYRDSVARSIGHAAIYFAIIEGSTPYDAKIDSNSEFVDLSKMWYASYFLLKRELIENCEDCEYKIVTAPSYEEAITGEATLPFVVEKR